MLDALRVFRSWQRSARADRWHHCCSRLRGGAAASEGRSIIARFERTIEVLCGRGTPTRSMRHRCTMSASQAANALGLVLHEVGAALDLVTRAPRHRSGCSRARLTIAVSILSGILFQIRRGLGLPSTKASIPPAWYRLYQS